MNTMARWVGRVLMWGGFLTCLLLLIFFVPKVVVMANDMGVSLSSPARLVKNNIQLTLALVILIALSISALEFKYDYMLKAGLVVAALILGFIFFTFMSAYGSLLSVIP